MLKKKNGFELFIVPAVWLQPPIHVGLTGGFISTLQSIGNRRQRSISTILLSDHDPWLSPAAYRTIVTPLLVNSQSDIND